jgi:hypothetical protein
MAYSQKKTAMKRVSNGVAILAAVIKFKALSKIVARPRHLLRFTVGRSAAVWICVVACVMFGALSIHPASAASALVGVNIVGPDQLDEQQQDALIAQLRHENVKTIRTGFVNDKNILFIIRAYKAGISTIGLVFPDQIVAGKQKSPADPTVGRHWGVPAFSDIDPEGFRNAFAPHLAALEAAGVKLAAIELGNEFNTPAFNGDFILPGSGRVLGISDLKNRNDPEGRAVAAGYLVYLRVLAVLKDVRDHSQLSKATAIISGGLADIGIAGTVKSHSHADYVGIPDTIEFLRQNGMDKLVDGYGVHTYPNNDPHQPVSTRIQTFEQRGLFAACRQGAKPCWLTEWGFSRADKSCPINDDVRLRLVQAERQVFLRYIQEGRLAAAFYYAWSGLPKDTENEWAVVRCGALTDAGKLAIRPL